MSGRFGTAMISNSTVLALSSCAWRYNARVLDGLSWKRAYNAMLVPPDSFGRAIHGME